MNASAKSDESAAPVVKPKFVLPPALAATLVGSGVAKGNSPITIPVSDDGKVAPKMPLKVSNQEFIYAIFGNLPEGISALVCAKAGDPTNGPWIAQPASQVTKVCPQSSNTYVNCSTVRPDEDGVWRARKSNVAGYHFLLLDDVGTKVPRERLGELHATWAIETSPGNYQLGIVLTKPLTDLAEVTRLQEAVIAAGMCDPGATGAARWARMPGGINGKEKHRENTGEPFKCRLVEYRPELRYTVKEIVAMLKLDMPSEQRNVAVAPIPMGAMAIERVVNPADVAKLPGLLAHISSDCDRKKWVNAMMAIYNTTSGSAEGLELFDGWSRGCKARYPGRKSIETQWHSLDKNALPATPITIATLVAMAREARGQKTVSVPNEAFEPCETIVVAAGSAVAKNVEVHVQVASTNPLAKFSLKDSLVELERNKVEQIQILGRLVLLGQATVIYARHNTGKTLILIFLIISAITQGLIDPAKIVYVNMDDNSNGLVEKVRLAQEYGFHMAADGHKGFQVSELRAAMEKMIADDSARGVVVILDTLKKFVNTMNKDASREFTKVVRRFCLKGGTVVALSHVNKNTDAKGKVVYTGTTDIVDDFDCAYTLEAVEDTTATDQKFVEFANIKRRGNVALTAAYSYSTEEKLSYDELLLSVQEVDPVKLQPIKEAAALLTDATIIAAVKDCIGVGTNTKMLMVDAVSRSTNSSRRAVLQVIEKYTGEDSNKHRWRFAVRARGAKVYELLDGANGKAMAPAGTPMLADATSVLPKTVISSSSADEQAHANILSLAIASYGGGATALNPEQPDQEGY